MHALIPPQAIARLEAIPGVVGITGDCGFLMNYQKEARRQAKLPCFISAVMQCHILSCSFSVDEEFLVLTANGESLRPSFNKMLTMAHVTDPERQARDASRTQRIVDASHILTPLLTPLLLRQARFHVLGCENVDGFDAVAKGEKVDVPRVTPGIVKIASEAVAKNPKIRAILLECTELPPYADSLRRALKMPVLDALSNREHTAHPPPAAHRTPAPSATVQVLDAITLVDFFHSAVTDNPVFGIDFHAVEEEAKVPPGTHDARLRPAPSGSYSLGDAVAPRSYSVS